MPTAIQTAIQHHQSNRLADAEQIYRQILAETPSDPEALHLLGVLAGQTGRAALGADLIRRAIAASPNQPIYHCNLGLLLFNSGQIDQAIACYQQALSN